ncbi:MAG TPA: hypothetical protein PK819_14800, partial [Thermomicrobiales bacterium]|nr:hypothetical protein [Thermomicrobiales bacterium]
SAEGKSASPKKTKTPEEEETPADDETPVPDETASELPEGSVVVYLEAATEDGPVVLGSLIPDGRNSAQIQVFVLGGETGATYTVSFNDGTCRRPGDVVVEVGETDSAGMLDETIDSSVEDLSSGDVVMVLSDSDSGDVVACGDPSEFVE